VTVAPTSAIDEEPTREGHFEETATVKLTRDPAKAAAREGGKQARGENRGRKEEEEQGEMDETVGNDEFERLDNFFEKMMLGEFEQLQEALISGPREQVYERLNQRKFEQNILEPTPTIARELSKSQDLAVTALYLVCPPAQHPCAPLPPLTGPS
jgi:hypothetical protein